LQCSVPGAHTPRSFDVHAAPPPGSPSSTTPSQLLSLPSHSSAVAGFGVHVLVWPSLHAGTVFWHSPPPHETVPSPSSTFPLQSSSTPLHCSGLLGPGVHVAGTPFTQFCAMVWHAPTPHAVVPRPSST